MPDRKQERERLERLWQERHPNPSGLPDGHPDKKPQALKAAHEIEGAAFTPKDARPGAVGYAKAIWKPSPNYTPGRAGHNPDWNASDPSTWITDHTMVGTEQMAYDRFKQPAQQASSTYGVCLDGRIFQYVDEVDAPWTNGTMQGVGSNLDSVTIEHEDAGDFNGPRTIALYEASAGLHADIYQRRNIPLIHRGVGGGVIGHRECSGASTACPDSLDTAWIIARAKAKLAGRDWIDEELLHLANTYSWDEIKSTLGQAVYDRAYKLVHPGPVPVPTPPTPPAGWKVSDAVKPFTASLSVFSVGSVLAERYEGAKVVSLLSVSSTVSVTGYSYASPPAHTSDTGNSQPGDDDLWWQVSGGWVPDAILDTSGVAGTPQITTFDPLTPPDTRPEWLRNLKSNPQVFQLNKLVPIIQMPTGVTVGNAPTGPLVVAAETTTAGVDFWVTTYGADPAHGNGMKKKDVAEAVLPLPVPPTPTPVPVPTPAPIPVPAPVDPVTAFFRALYEWIKAWFNPSTK